MEGDLAVAKRPGVDWNKNNNIINNKQYKVNIVCLFVYL